MSSRNKTLVTLHSSLHRLLPNSATDFHPPLPIRSQQPLRFPIPTMPTDDYTPVVRGALKLKGSGPSGVTKKKKKSKTPKTPKPESSSASTSALQKALQEEDNTAESANGRERGDGDNGAELRELEERGNDGKTASERAREEMRRKRVCLPITLPWALPHSSCFACSRFQDRFWGICTNK